MTRATFDRLMAGVTLLLLVTLAHVAYIDAGIGALTALTTLPMVIASWAIGRQ